MSVVLGPNQYGKAQVRLFTVDRRSARHRVRDLVVGTHLRGDFAATHLTGDNSQVVATDTQKNTVYALAREHGVGSIEEFALLLGRHFTGSYDWISGGAFEVAENPWDRIRVGGTEHDHAFVRNGGGVRTTVVTIDGTQEWVVSGLTELTVLKTTGSEFWGFPRDRFTTLQETRDRVLATSVTARWRYLDGGVDFDASFADVRRVLLESFARTHSLSLQQTLFRIGEDVLTSHAEIAEVRLSMPNKHHVLVDLSPFGLDNPDAVYQVLAQPYGLIEGTVARDDAPAAGRAWESVTGFC